MTIPSTPSLAELWNTSHEAAPRSDHWELVVLILAAARNVDPEIVRAESRSWPPRTRAITLAELVRST